MSEAARRPSPPVEGRIDRGQLRAIVTLLVGQALRSGIDPSSGTKVRPLRQLAISMGLLGFFFLSNLQRCADLPSYLALVFATAFLIVFFGIVPDTQVVRERHAEILASKPLARRTAFVARGLMLMITAGLLALLFGIIPIAGAAWGFAASLPLIAGELVMLVLGAFCTAVLWLVLVTLALHFVPPERVRWFSQTVLVGLMLVVTFTSIGMGPSFSGGFHADGMLRFLPSTWFARALVGGNPAALFERWAVAAVLVLAGVLAFARPLELIVPDLVEPIRVTEERVRAPLLARALRRLAGVPLLGRLLLPGSSGAVARAILTNAGREEMNAMRGLVNHAIALVFFAYSWWGGGIFGTNILLYLTLMGAIEGSRSTRQSTQAAGSWLFFGAPVRPAHVLRGIEAAALLRSVGLPLLLLALLDFREHPPILATLLFIGYALAARTAVAATLAASPAMPLSEEAGAPSFVGLVASFFAGVTVMTAHQFALMAVGAIGPYGLAVTAIGDLILVVLGFLAATIAEDRLARLESPA